MVAALFFMQDLGAIGCVILFMRCCLIVKIWVEKKNVFDTISFRVEL